MARVTKMRLAPFAWLCALVSSGPVPPAPGPAPDPARARMVEVQIAARGVKDPAVLAAMREVPRHLFVRPVDLAKAYDDHPLSIGHGQTISQPYIVALMTELALPRPGHVALEVGTGSGYQAAVLSRIVGRVYTIELLEPLATTATRRLADLGYDNVTVRAGDGYNGWPEEAPFDIILVTASSPDIPPPLVQQLKAGGRMIIPIGATGDTQELRVVEKKADGSLDVRTVIPVRFVPLLRQP
jgi:protein-L-isoaspartate(D-aspartate) O-methyltransferase